MNQVPKSAAVLAERALQGDFDAWQRSIVRLGGCTNPIHLVGNTTLADARTGEVLHSFASDGRGGRLVTACGNRRTSVCPTCARLYRADTYQLIRADLVGGKETNPEVSAHPRVFVTLTAPGFGPVHTRRERNGRLRSCRPRKVGENCPHDVPVGCFTRHAENDPELGEPLCPRCYDYAGAVLWQALAGQLWHRFAMELRRELARRVGVTRTGLGTLLRLSYAKVAEYQRRGLVHFHAVIRLDGPEGAASLPPGWASTQLLTDAVNEAVGRVSLPAPGGDVIGDRTLRLGQQLDVRPIKKFGAGERLTSAAVAAYIAKYATKGAEAAGAVDGRIHRSADLAMLPVRAHTRRMIATCWWLGGLPQFEALRLRQWAHMLGYGGHFSTKSRRYSTTLTALRQARAEYRAEEQMEALGFARRPTVAVGQWRYVGRGYSAAEELIAAGVRASRMEASG